MNRQASTRQYEKFTPEERMRLTLAARARGDIKETKRLAATCPRASLIGADPEYQKRFINMVFLNGAVIQEWVEVSHYVICSDLLGHLAARELIESPLSAENRKRVADTRATHKICSTLWIGIESAITDCCREFQLTRDELFAVHGPLPSVIERARNHLAPHVAVNRAHERDLARRLRHSLKRNLAERLRRSVCAAG